MGKILNYCYKKILFVPLNKSGHSHIRPTLFLLLSTIVTNSHSFKLLDLYDIEQRFVCADSLDQYNLQTEQLIISAEKIDRTSLINKLSQAEKVFTF